MNLEVCTTPDVFDRLGEDWNPLLARSQSNLIFLTYEWQKSWWQAYHPGELWIVVARTEEGHLVGIAPWFVEHRPDERVLRAIGCVDVTDYLAVIADQAYEQAFFAALAECIAAAGDEFDRVSLCNIPEGSSTFNLLPTSLEKQGMTVEVSQQEVCPIISLPGEWDDYLSILNKKQRHELRRKIRRLGVQSDWYIVGPEHDLNAATEQFLHLMAASTEDKASFLQDAHNDAFFRMMIPRIMAQGWLRLIFLTINGEPAASYLNFDYNNRILVYNSGQDTEQFGAYSPGIVLLARDIRYAIEQGRAEYDFLRGNEPYKYQMGGQDARVYKLIATQA